MVRARDLFEQALEGCPAAESYTLFLLYAKYEEEHGLVTHIPVYTHPYTHTRTHTRTHTLPTRHPHPTLHPLTPPPPPLP